MEKASEPLRKEQTTDPDRLCLETRRKIRKLQARASRGLWAMAFFVAVSLGALRDFDFLPSLPEKVRDLLGASPPVTLISTALIVYSFSAIILVLSRMTMGSGAYGGMAHVGYLTAFYAFYHYAGAMEDNFWAVFAAGMTILGLESYHIWTHYRDLVREVEKMLARLQSDKEG